MNIRLLLLSGLLCLLTAQAPAQRLSPLAPAPDWNSLEAFQETITRAEFKHLLEDVYAPDGAARGLIEIQADSARILKTIEPPTEFTLRFVREGQQPKPVPRFWKSAAERPKSAKPLSGVKVAIDPGHLGGPWAKMEERWFQIGDSAPVTEGDMTLKVAEHLAPLLEGLGAEVLWVRRNTTPCTPERPETLRAAARRELALLGIPNPQESYTGTSDRANTVQFHSEMLFYRTSEIRHRALLLNTKLRPDITLCLHFNAEAWGDPLQPTFVPNNHLHLLINGCFSNSELLFDDLRFDMLHRLLSGYFPEELAASNAVASSMAQITGLPPYQYPGKNAQRFGPNPYVWIRNLLANRIYRSPVLYLEPYVMNHQDAWERIQAGDYSGERIFAGVSRPSIYREYAQAVANGLANHYRGTPP